MFVRPEPDHKEQRNIRLVVENEQDLYTTFSPTDEFNDSVKGYIRSKMTSRGFNRYTGLTVVSRKHIDEKRFRSAVSNWVRDEKRVLSQNRKETVRLLIGLLLFGSVLVVYNITLQQKYEVARYSLVPIMGSLSLSRATGYLIIDLPIISSKIKTLNTVEKGSVITFEYHIEEIQGTGG